MHEYAPITTGLRDWWERHVAPLAGDGLSDGLAAQCDMLDAVHHNLERENERLKAELDRVSESRTVATATCHKVWRKDGYGFCSECGYNITGDWAVYCPSCGRKVIDE